MALEDIIPNPTTVGVVFPATVGVDYASAVGEVSKFPDQQRYTIDKIYGMVRAALVNAKVDPERVTLDWFLFFFREILNDYSEHVGEFQLAFVFTGGGGIFRVPSMRSVIALNVNGYPGCKIDEGLMTHYRAGDETTSSDAWYYSLNGNLLSVYPAIGSDDTITVLASVFAEDFNEDSADTILPQADYSTLYHGCRWKCLEDQNLPFVHAMEEYFRKRGERQTRVEGQMFSGQVSPAPHLT